MKTKNRNITVSITIEEAYQLYLDQDKKCALTGVEIGFAYKDNSASLDRLDSSGIYEIGNVQWVHQDVNFAKQSMSTEDFISLCRSVVSHSGACS